MLPYWRKWEGRDNLATRNRRQLITWVSSSFERQMLLDHSACGPYLWLAVLLILSLKAECVNILEPHQHFCICIRLVEATWLKGVNIYEKSGSPFLSAQNVWQTNGETEIMHGVHAAERQGWIHSPKCMHNWVPIKNLLGLCKLLKFLFMEVWILNGGCYFTS